MTDNCHRDIMDALDIRVLIKPTEGGGYYAQVIEYDLAADGRNFHATLAELSRVINVHIASCLQMQKKPFESLDAAPSLYETLWRTGTPIDMQLPDLKPVECPAIHTQLAVA